jgi:hypothetical protein
VVEIKLLGSFSIQINGKEIPPEAWRLRKVKNLVKLLALAPGHQLHRDQVIEYLVARLGSESCRKPVLPDTARCPQNAGPRRKVGPAISHLSRRTAPAYVQRSHCGSTSTHSQNWRLWLVKNATQSHIKGLWTSIQAIYCQKTGTRCGQNQLARDYTDLHQELLFELAVLEHQQQNYSKAIELLNRIVALDDTYEEAHVLLMRLYAETGQRREAIQQYQTLKNTLKNELGLEPLPETTSLFDDILHDRVAQAIRAEAPGLPPRARHNLPSQISSFIGRTREIDSVVQLLSANRLVTITGAGGTGKTRLALKAAEQVLDDYPHGVWWVELAPIFDPALILKEVAEVLSVYELPGHTLAESVEETPAIPPPAARVG